MSGIVEPPKIIMKTLEINRYTYDLINLIPHTSAQYRIFCYCDDVEVKYLTGLLEKEQYKEWVDDDWLDIFIRQKVESLPDVEVKPQPVQPDIPIEPTVESEIPIEPTVKTELPVEEIPIEPTEIPV